MSTSSSTTSPIEIIDAVSFVTTSSLPAEGGLPATGVDLFPLVATGAGCFLAGALLVAIRHRANQLDEWVRGFKIGAAVTRHYQNRDDKYGS